MKKIPSSIIVLTAILGLFWTSCYSQKIKPSAYGIKSKKALQSYLKGLDFDKYRDRATAMLHYQQAVEIEPNFGEAWFRMGVDTYFLVQEGSKQAPEYKKGLEYMNKADKMLTGRDRNPMVSFYLGELNFYTENYAPARKAYEDFINSKPMVKKEFLTIAKLNLGHCVFAEKAILEPIKFVPKNLGPNINSMGQEYLPYLTADDEILFFTARRKECTGEYSAELRDFAEDFFFSEKKNGDWQMLENLGPPVNTELNEGAASFSPDGQYVYFTGCNRKDGFGSCDLYVSKLNGRVWSEPENLGPTVNSPGWDSQPCISNDGKTLYFASTRNGGKGQSDIWFTTKVNGSWTPAQNLGEPINTIGRENSPFLHADGQTLYFSSDEHPGFGGFDLFLSKSVHNGWGRPMNLGYPLNTNADERNIFVNAKGDKGFTNSDRDGGLGGYDIYSFELDERIRPKFTTFVRGVVLDNVTSKPLEGTLTFINLETGDTIRQVASNSYSGKFLLSLPMDQDYAAFSDAKGYLFKSQNFTLKGAQEEYFDLIIRLDPIEEGKPIVLENIFYETAKFDLKEESEAELNHLVYFMKINPKITIEISGHTDDVGSDQDNLLLSDNRANSVKKYLVEKGIPDQRITAVGYGESRPMFPNDSDEHRAKNRRTELKVTGK
ncbi:MAG: PD40 domain-containing protein [Bacteroidia bacterium]|nr:PD40 domain-containing protein [Bacteroidia bacterium]